MASNAVKWNETLINFKTEVVRLFTYMENATKEMGGPMGKGKKGGKGGRVSMLGSNEPCNYNY